MKILKYFILFTCFYTASLFSEDLSDRVIDLNSLNDQEIINSEEGEMVKAYYYNSYCSHFSCPVCTLCRGSPLVSLPFISNNFLYNLALAHRQMCAYQYQICVFNSSFYGLYACNNYYYTCLGYAIF